MEIVDNTLEITDNVRSGSGGPTRHKAKLTTQDVSKLKGLASRVAQAGDQIDTESGGVDGGQTVVEVDDGSAKSRVEIRRGRMTGQEVWDLLDVVEDLADQQQAQG